MREAGTATSVRHDGSRTVSSDRPFIESKEYLTGLIFIEQEDLDGALAVADELQRLRPGAGGVEVRPLLEEPPVGA